jgi:hypothetical protein
VLVGAEETARTRGGEDAAHASVAAAAAAAAANAVASDAGGSGGGDGKGSASTGTLPLRQAVWAGVAAGAVLLVLAVARGGGV